MTDKKDDEVVRPWWAYLPVPFVYDDDRIGYRDLGSILLPANGHPDPEDPLSVSPYRVAADIPPEYALSPIDRLMFDAAKLGVKVLDLRGLPRDKLYPFRYRCVERNGEILSLPKKAIQEGDVDHGIWGWYGRRKKRRRGETLSEFEKDRKKNKPLRGRARGELGWAKSTTTVLHTMDVVAGAPRCLGMPVHSAIAQDATIVLLQPLHARMWHAHAANGFSDGIEFSGRKGAIDDKQIAAGRILLRYVYAEKQRHAQIQRFVSPHAFSHWSRAGDPGKKIWEAIGIWGMREFGMQLGPVVGSGTRPAWAKAA